MIGEVLNREFVLNQLEAASEELRLRSGQRRGGTGEGAHDAQVATEDYLAAADAVDETLSAEKAESSGPSGFDLPSPRRDGSGAPSLDESCFISSNPIVSIAQSALEVYFDHPDSPDKVYEDGSEGEEPSQRRDDGNETGEIFVTDRSLGVSSRRFLDKFSITDPGWFSSLVAMGITNFRKRHPFNNKPAPTHVLADRCRLVMVGDWGSGLPRAQKVAREMRKYVEESIKDDVECHVVHLGDVYYSGWEYEYRKRFLRYWPVKTEERDKVGSWSLNGNHDMYSGGHAYYGTLLADPRFAKQAKSSFFRLANAAWQIIGLDTAYDDNGLKDPQAAWLADTLARNDQRAILLTHHQFFSVYENAPSVGRALTEKLGPLLSDNRIYGAVWGHEHRCVLHAAHGGLQFARLLGNGGVPVYMTHDPAAAYPSPAIYEDRRYLPSGLERWAYMGFAVIDLDARSLRARYIDEFGWKYREENV